MPIGLLIIVVGLLVYGRFSKYNIYKLNENGSEKLVVEYTESGSEIRTVVGDGFRATKVLSADKDFFEMYLSQENEKFDLSKTPTRFIIMDIENYHTDSLLGKYINYN